MIRALPGAAINASRDVIDIRCLAPNEHLICDTENPSELQDSICVCAALLWRAPDGTVPFWADYLLEAPDHACGRFLQHAPDGDLAAALFAAAAVFAAGDVNEICKNRSIYLPTAQGGVFVAEPMRGKSKNSGRITLFARGRTFLTDSMLNTDQVPIQPASSPAQSVATMLLSFAHQGSANGHNRLDAALGKAGLCQHKLPAHGSAFIAPSGARPRLLC